MISVHVVGPKGREQLLNCVIDTGYNGRLTLPMKVIQELELEWVRHGAGELADGSTVTFGVYDAAVVWDGRKRDLRIDHSESTPLIGMSLMDGYVLTVQCRIGGKLTLKPLPASKPR